MDGAGGLDLRSGADCPERKTWPRGRGLADGRPAGGGLTWNRPVLAVDQQEPDGAEQPRRRDGVWPVAGNLDAGRLGSAAIWRASGSACVHEGVACASCKRRALYGGDDAAVELGNDTGSSLAGGSPAEYGAANGIAAGGVRTWRASRAGRVGWRWVDSGGCGDADDAQQDAGQGADA